MLQTEYLTIFKTILVVLINSFMLYCWHIFKNYRTVL